MPVEARVLVTGAGGPAGVALVRDLVRRGIHVTAGDCDSWSAGLHLADESAVLPRSDDPTYVDELCRLAAKGDADLLISTLAEEVPVLHQRADTLDSAGLRRWLPSVETVRSCIDKWTFWETTSRAGVAVPATALGEAGNVPGPWIVKPRFGRGSRDVYAADSTAALDAAIERVPEPIVQHRLEGREFTVDALVARNGTLAGAVPRWRIQTTGGISVRGETFDSQDVVAAVAHALAAVALKGSANVQGFVAPSGAVTIVEINPRFSGALPLSQAAGADFIGEHLRGAAGLPVRPDRLIGRPGVRMTRHLEEVFEG